MCVLNAIYDLKLKDSRLLWHVSQCLVFQQGSAIRESWCWRSQKIALGSSLHSWGAIVGLWGSTQEGSEKDMTDWGP